jgi:hypothetical protein
MKNLFLFIGMVCFILTICQETEALIVKYTVDELAKRAEQVIMGEVTSLKPRWNKDQEPIYTEITLNVLEVWKGEITTKSITIEQIGGTYGETSLTIPDAAEFKIGTKVILFIDRKEDKTDLAGWFQGKFNIDGDMAIQEKTGYKVSLTDLKNIVSQNK